MKNKFINIITTLFIILLILNNLSIVSHAASGYVDIVISGGQSGQGSQITNAGGTILSIVLAIGASVAAVILVWLGIKYISAAPDEKANIKKSAVTYIIGCVVLFGFTGVLSLIVRLSEDIGSSLG